MDFSKDEFYTNRELSWLLYQSVCLLIHAGQLHIHGHTRDIFLLISRMYHIFQGSHPHHKAGEEEKRRGGDGVRHGAGAQRPVADRDDSGR